MIYWRTPWILNYRLCISSPEVQTVSWKLIYVYFHLQPRLILSICETVILIHRSCSRLLSPKGNLKPHILLYIPWVLALHLLFIYCIFIHGTRLFFLHWTLYVKGWNNRFSYSKYLIQGFIYFNRMLFICDFFSFLSMMVCQLVTLIFYSFSSAVSLAPKRTL